MSYVMYLIVGICTGFLARAIVLKRYNLNLLTTLLLGIAGSMMGGAIGTLIAGDQPEKLETANISGCILGALAVLGVLAAMAHHRARIQAGPH